MHRDVWKAGIDALRREGHHVDIVGSVLQEVASDERVADVFPGCRLFRIDSEMHPRDGDRLAIQRWFVLRPGDARPYQIGRDEDVVALARAEETWLDSARAASAFAQLALRWDRADVRRWGDRGWLVEGETARIILKLDAAERLAAIVHVGVGCDATGP